MTGCGWTWQANPTASQPTLSPHLRSVREPSVSKDEAGKPAAGLMVREAHTRVLTMRNCRKIERFLVLTIAGTDCLELRWFMKSREEIISGNYNYFLESGAPYVTARAADPEYIDCFDRTVPNLLRELWRTHGFGTCYRGLIQLCDPKSSLRMSRRFLAMMPISSRPNPLPLHTQHLARFLFGMRAGDGCG